jgi:hypothetical protein
MSPIDDDDIDALLRQSFDGPTPDAGFSDRLMQQLPPRRRRFAWPLVAGVLTGTALGVLSLSNSPLWRASWQGWMVGEWSASGLVVVSMMAGLTLLAVGWSLAEADDH